MKAFKGTGERQKERPKVTEVSIMRKIFEGLHTNRWDIVGSGGTKKGMIKPLVDYLKSKGVDVT